MGLEELTNITYGKFILEKHILKFKNVNYCNVNELSLKKISGGLYI